MKRVGSLTIVMLFLAGVTAFGQIQPKDIQGAKEAKESKVLLKGDLNMKLGLSGTWWRAPFNVQSFNLTSDQQKKMDEVFQESRVRLIALDADLRTQEALLDPLMSAERLDEAKTLAQIDKVAQARAELEKANARMLLGIRQVLTPEQRTILEKRESKIKSVTSKLGPISKSPNEK